MNAKIKAVQQFHEAFKIGYSTSLKADLGTAKNTLRFDLMKEENEEYLEARISWKGFSNLGRNG